MNPSHAAGLRRGFSLIELMIVVAVVAVLTAVAMPTYTRYVLRTHRVDAKNALLDLSTRQERYFSINNAYTNSATALGYSSAFPFAVRSSGASYYNLTVSAASATTYTATATPTGGQTSDSCGTFSITQAGARTTTSGDSSCW